MPPVSSELDDEASLKQNTQLHPAIIFLVGSGPNSTLTGLYADFVRENLEGLCVWRGFDVFRQTGNLVCPRDAGTAPIYAGADDARAAVQFCGNKPVLIPSELEWLGIHKAERSHKY